jgi:hypothetical protein
MRFIDEMKSEDEGFIDGDFYKGYPGCNNQG